MRTARFRHDGAVYEGSVDGDALVVEGEEFHIDSVEFLPVCQPTKIIGCAMNFEGVLAELDMERPERPRLFFKPPSALVGHGDEVVLAEYETVFEGELAVVIDRPCRNVDADEALDYVRGYTVVNDVTAFGWQEREDQWVRTKGMDTFCPCGPFLQTDVPDADPELDVETTVNGEVLQSSNTRNLVFPVSEVVAEISRFMTLCEGDLIPMGAPPGVAPLSPGDRVEVTVEGVGTLSNTVA